MTQRANLVKSILIIDDDAASLSLHTELIQDRIKATVVPTRFAHHGLRLANTELFDFVLVDVTMQFNGSPYGGLEVYRSLLGRYGTSSLIAYSQLVTDELLKTFDYKFNFSEKGKNPLRFAEKLVELMHSLRLRQSCFLAMPFEARYDTLHQEIAESVRRCGYDPIRLDEKQFTDSIVKQIMGGIQAAKFVIFVATDRNPNAFYECGYAVAMNKEVITLTDDFKNLPFDIRDRPAIVYGANLKQAKVELEKRIDSFTQVVRPDYVMAEP